MSDEATPRASEEGRTGVGALGTILGRGRPGRQGRRAHHEHASPRRTDALRFVTPAELAVSSPREVAWLVHGYIAEGAVTEINGRAKSAGKTTFLLRAVRAVLDGSEFLGRAAGRSAVVYLSEERVVTLQQGLARARLLGRDDLAFLLWNEAVHRKWADVVEAAVAECRRRGARLLIVDTLGQFAVLQGAGENSAADAFDVLGPLQRAAASGLAVVIVRHERKAGGEVGQSGRGSTAFTGGADIVIKVAQGKGSPNARVLTAQSRFDETPRSLTIELAGDGYRILDDEPEVAEEAETARERVARELLAVAPASEDEAATERELRGLLAGRTSRTVPPRRHRYAARAGHPAAPWRGQAGRPAPLLGI